MVSVRIEDVVLCGVKFTFKARDRFEVRVRARLGYQMVGCFETIVLCFGSRSVRHRSG